jgi:hypothetical protein
MTCDYDDYPEYWAGKEREASAGERQLSVIYLFAERC